MDQDRRNILKGAATGMGALAAADVAAALDPIPPAPASPAPGRPGDFDFLAGEWRIAHQRKLPSGEWDAFAGEATCWTILGGVGSVEELRIPARDFSGLGLRLLDVERRIWADHWVNSRSGIMTAPGVTGSFIDGVGVFISDDMDQGQPIKVAGVWDRITSSTCRWRQAVSRDAGATWAHNWIMDWTRAA